MAKPSTSFLKKTGAGFSLTEILIAFFLFILIMGGVINLLQAAVRIQRDTLEEQAAIEEASFLTGYISRAFRGIQKATDASCVTSGPGWNFQVVTFSPTHIELRFIDKDGRCREFIWNNNELREKINGGSTNLIVSDDFAMPVFSLQSKGAFQGTPVSPDYVQPHLTMSFSMQSIRSGNIVTSMQTTITQRKIDVRE